MERRRTFGGADAGRDGPFADLAARVALRHASWESRLKRQRLEGQEKQSEVERQIGELKTKMTAGTDEVERGLKQYELVKRLSEATSWEDMVPPLEKKSLKYFFRAEGWALYLTDESGRLTLAQRRGAIAEPRPDDAARQESFLMTFVPSTGMAAGQHAWVLGIPLWRLHDPIGLLLLRLPGLDADQQAAI